MMKGHEPPNQLGAGWNPAAQQLQKPGIARALTYARLLTSTGAAVVLVVAGLQFALPEGNRPADWIGRFHGIVESAEAEAKQHAMVELARSQAEEVNREQMKVQAELEILRQQMQTLANTMAGQTELANGADWVCALGQAVPFLTNDRDFRSYGKVAEQACGYSDRIREQQQAKYVELSRRHSALVQRIDELHRQLVELRSRAGKAGAR